MSNFVLSNTSAQLVDYVDGVEYRASLPLTYDSLSSVIRSNLGLHNTSGVELDRTNLVYQFDGDAETTGISSVLRYQLTALPTFLSSVDSTISFRMLSGIDEIKESNETEVFLELDVVISTDAEGVTHIYAKEGSYTGAIDSPSVGTIGLSLSFLSGDEIAIVHELNGEAVLDLKFFSFLSKLDPYAEFINFGLESNYHLEIGGTLPINTWGGEEVETISSVMPISVDSNQAPQWSGVIADQTMDEEGVLNLDLTGLVDDPEGQALTITVSGGGATVTTLLNETQTQLQLTATTDYYTSTPLEIAVKAEDSVGGYTVERFQLTVNDLNDALSAIALSNQVSSLPEDQDTSSRTLVANILITDDSVGSNTISLSGADASLFEVESSERELYLKNGVVLDYETTTGYEVTVTAEDSSVAGSSPVSVIYALSVTDMNEAPSSVSVSPVLSAMIENSDTGSRIKVADLSVTDDALGTHTLSVVTGDDSALFEIEGAELFLKAGVSLDFESQNSYTVTTSAQDITLGDSAAVTAAYTLTLQDQNEAPTVTSAPTATVIDEAGIGTVLYTVTASDPDAGANFTFSLGGDDGERFSIDSGSGVITMAEIVNFEAKSSYAIEVTVSDGSLSDTQPLAVTVSNDVLTYYWGESNKPVTEVVQNGVTFERTTSAHDSDAISLTDVLLSLKYYLGKSSLSEYAVAAADYNGDESVNLTDVLQILKSYLGKTEAPPVWHFVDGVADLPGGADVVGVLRGDVDGSWESPTA